MHATSLVKYNVRKLNAERGKVDGLSNTTVRCIWVDQDAAKGGTYYHSSTCPTPGLKLHNNNLLQPQFHHRSSSNHVMFHSPDGHPCHCHQPSDVAILPRNGRRRKRPNRISLSEKFGWAVHSHGGSKMCTPRASTSLSSPFTPKSLAPRPISRCTFTVHEAVLAVTSETTTSVGDGTSRYVKGRDISTIVKWPTGRPCDHYHGGKWEGEWHCSEGWGKSQVFIQSGEDEKVGVRLDQKSWYAFYINPSSVHPAK